jgi:hypothetical protein
VFDRSTWSRLQILCVLYIMPGPSNMKKKRKSQGKSQKTKSAKPHSFLESRRGSSSSSSRSPSQHLVTPPPVHVITSLKKPTLLDCDNDCFAEELVPQLVPFIYDPGTGPRVRDTRAFLTSRYFSQPPALDVGYWYRAVCYHANMYTRYRYVPSLLKKRSCKCCVLYYPRRRPWYVIFTLRRMVSRWVLHP